MLKNWLFCAMLTPLFAGKGENRGGRAGQNLKIKTGFDQGRTASNRRAFHVPDNASIAPFP